MDSTYDNVNHVKRMRFNCISKEDDLDVQVIGYRRRQAYKFKKKKKKKKSQSPIIPDNAAAVNDDDDDAMDLTSPYAHMNHFLRHLAFERRFSISRRIQCQ